jgi:4-aminobutyrate aminotransferase-like enzyme
LLDGSELPNIVVPPPGLKSQEIVAQEFAGASKGYHKILDEIPIAIAEAKGSVEVDVDGNRYLTMSPGAGAISLGHNRSEIRAAVNDMMQRLDNVYPFTFPIRSQLYSALQKLLPPKINKIALVTTGSESVDFAVKAIKSYTKNYEFLSFWGSFHGKGHYELNLTSLPVTKQGFGPYAGGFLHAPFPDCYRCPVKQDYPDCGIACFHLVEDTIRYESEGRMAGVFIEPFEAAGGLIVPPKEWMQMLNDYCHEHDILIAVDEVYSGWGKTGKMWAYEHFPIEPDVICIGKSLGQGLPIAAVCLRQEIAETEPWAKPYSYAITHGGNPISCAAALATCQIYHKEQPWTHMAHLQSLIHDHFDDLKIKPWFHGDIRILGGNIAIELVKDPTTKTPDSQTASKILNDLFTQGIIAYHGGLEDCVIMYYPAVTITETQMTFALETLKNSITKHLT